MASLVFELNEFRVEVMCNVECCREIRIGVVQPASPSNLCVISRQEVQDGYDSVMDNHLLHFHVFTHFRFHGRAYDESAVLYIACQRHYKLCSWISG